MSDFVHLHTHSHYSLLDGVAKIKPLVKAAKERGFSALALTDNGSMYGAIEFYQVCKNEGIKPILGFKAYVAPRRMEDKDFEKDKHVFTLILLAETLDGYKNLIQLSSKGHLDGFFNGKPRIDKETIRQHANGVVALSGDIDGEVQQLLKSNDIAKATIVAKEYEDIFGKNNFFLELQDHPAIEGQIDVNTKLIQLSEDAGIPKVVTRDVHYLHTDDAEAQGVLRCISEGWTVYDTQRENFQHVDRSLNTAADIISRFRHVPDAIENTVKISERVSVDISLNDWHFADVDLPPGKSADEHLRDEALCLAPDFYPNMGKEIEDRIEYELDIIKTKGYSPYFICIADVVRYAKANGIVESTRGSAAGSLVSYILGITTVDPIRFRLPFERFLNPFRPSPPDIDTDFADDRRDEMIAYVTEKYGVDKVAQIITFGTMAARASVRDVGRVLGFSYSMCDQVAKLVPQGAQGFPMTLERALKEEPDLKKLYDSNEDVKRLLDLAQKVEGCARHTSIHAAGVVISPTPLTDFAPIQRETGGERILTQYSMYDIEAAGVLKNDFLGIRNLSILGKSVEIVEKTTGERVDIYNLPLDDVNTFEMISRGETMGVFQFGSSGMIRWIRELQPTNIDDIMAMVALYRPGPMDFIPEYIKRKHNPETIDYPHPDVEEILEKSLGLLIYQDDIMLTAIKLAGYDWLEADKFRKAMGKKDPALMKKQEKKFKDGCIKNKISRKIVGELWDQIKPFASYGFNKAHAASYGMVAYQTAYMKTNYPVQYMTSILQAEAKDIEKVAAIVHECDRMGIDVKPPDVNESFKNFAMTSKAGDTGRIRFGLTAIKNVGEHICEVIYRERKENGQYITLEDFLERVNDKDLNKKSLESLIQAGALDCFGHDRGLLLSNIENILFYSKHQKEKSITNQGSLFAGTAISLDDSVVLKDSSPATMDEKLLWEKTLLGIYVSSHPFKQYEYLFEKVITPLDKVVECERDSWVITGGVIDKVYKKITKKGDVMIFVTIQDRSGSMEYLVFPKTYEKTKNLWEEESIVVVVGKTSREDGDNKIFVENVYVVTPENAEGVSRQVSMGADLTFDKKSENEEFTTICITKEQLKTKADDLRVLFASHPGKTRVYLDVEGNRVKTETFVDADAISEGKIAEVLSY
jgi:DNA polymerase III subunit alpha